MPADMPWDKFFWADWEADQNLRLCSFAAQGLWMRCLCICARSDPKGYLAINGRAIDAASLARVAGGSEAEVAELLDELEANGVFSRDRNKTIYSRRMVKAAKRQKEGAKHAKKRWKNDGSDADKTPDEVSEKQQQIVRPNGSDDGSPNGEPYGPRTRATQKPEARSQNPPKPPLGEATNSSDSPKRAEWRDALETACGVDLSKVTSPGDHRAFEAMVDAAIDSGLSRAFLTEQLAAARKAKGDQPRSPGPYWRKVLDRIIADETGAGEDDDGPPPDPRREAAELRALRVKQFAETAATQPDWPWDEQRKGPRPSEAECAAAVAWDRSGPPPEIFFAYASKAEVGR